MKRNEIRRFFGEDSDTWKFYSRQSFLSRQRLSELVTIAPAQEFGKPISNKSKDEIRLVRFD